MQLICNKKPWTRLAPRAGAGGSLWGAVADPSRRPVPGARVTATETATAVNGQQPGAELPLEII